MRFNRYLPIEQRELLEKQYKEYLKSTPMTKKEKCALREWVKDGNSVFENSCGAWDEYGIPLEFLEVFREEEHIRKSTKEMTSEETRKFALHHYGWDDDYHVVEFETSNSENVPLYDGDEELPF